MRTIITPLLVASLLAPFARAQDKSDAPKARMDRVKAAKQELEDAESALYEKYQKAKDDAEKKAVLADRPKGATYAKKLWPLVTEDATDAAAADALVWIMRVSEDDADKQKAIDLLLLHHVKSEAIADVCLQLGYVPKKLHLDFVERVAKETPNDAVRGKATWAKAQLLGSAVRAAEALANETMTAEQRKSYEEYLGADTLAWLRGLDRTALATTREKLLESVAAKYADVKINRGTLGEAATAELFELRNLAIGKQAPDIAGKDADGVAFKLSDYRGKVVVLDFWGFW